MMRHGLQCQVGMEQANSYQIYNSRTDHEMKEERQHTNQVASEFRDKHRKAAKHLRTKETNRCNWVSNKLEEQVSLLRLWLCLLLGRIPPMCRQSITGVDKWWTKPTLIIRWWKKMKMLGAYVVKHWRRNYQSRWLGRLPLQMMLHIFLMQH